MNQQEMIDRDIRLLIGDMQLQLLFAKARIAALESAKEEAAAAPLPEEPKPNGHAMAHATE
jgi:hypothetical protein